MWGVRPVKACLKGNREKCGCYESRDIGEYDTCPHGCVYCYVVQNQTLAKDRYRLHDPLGQALFSLAGDDASHEDNSQFALFPDSRGDS
jgi:Domain of unknown function (DUF1848)